MCAYKRDVLNNTYNNNDIPQIGSVLQFEYSCFPLRRIENGWKKTAVLTWDES